MKTVAVLGGGPAGAFAAERLAQAGLRTTIFDEKLVAADHHEDDLGPGVALARLVYGMGGDRGGHRAGQRALLRLHTWSIWLKKVLPEPKRGGKAFRDRIRYLAMYSLLHWAPGGRRGHATAAQPEWIGR